MNKEATGNSTDAEVSTVLQSRRLQKIRHQL